MLINFHCDANPIWSYERRITWEIVRYLENVGISLGSRFPRFDTQLRAPGSARQNDEWMRSMIPRSTLFAPSEQLIMSRSSQETTVSAAVADSEQKTDSLSCPEPEMITFRRW